MILPIRTNIRPRRTPYVNYVLIVVNVMIFLLTYLRHYSIVDGVRVVEPLRAWAQVFMLFPVRPALWQFVSYAFLHGGFMHIIGNMFFLYLFGNNVNDKLGHIGYLCFYLAGAIFSGIGHSLLSQNPALGASGAVAAVTGAYLVLFPQTLITVLYWLIFIGTIEIPAIYFIGLKMILLDNVIFTTTPNVAYSAHLTGYGFGITSIFILLSTGLLSGSMFDLWSIFKRWNKQRRYRDSVSQGYDPFKGSLASKSKEVKKSPAEREKEQKILKLRKNIALCTAEGNLSEAADLYAELMRIDKDQVLPRQSLLDIANQLMACDRWAESAGAYEKFLSHYRKYEYSEQVELMLGILYSRYLNKPAEAIKHLTSARIKLRDTGQIEMCDQELSRLAE